MKNRILMNAFLIAGLFLIAIPLKAQQEKTGTVTDIDGNVYHTITIGQQVWMVENLKTTKYRDGKPIPNITDKRSWRKLTTGACCDFNNTPSNTDTYGKLYNWYAVTNSGNICPTGWHVPTDAEWTTLETFLGGDSIAGGKLKEAGYAHWAKPNNEASNISGFTALPGGCRLKDGGFISIKNYGDWWSSSENSSPDAWFRYLDFNYGGVFRYAAGKAHGFSVRCIRDVNENTPLK
jgi:uncharacterized protein (TIGR02145 family)